MNFVTDRAGQSKDGDLMGRLTRTAAWLGGAGGRPGGPVWSEGGWARATEAGLAGRSCGPRTDTRLGRAGESRMSNRWAVMARLPWGRGRG